MARRSNTLRIHGKQGGRFHEMFQSPPHPFITHPVIGLHLPVEVRQMIGQTFGVIADMSVGGHLPGADFPLRREQGIQPRCVITLPRTGNAQGIFQIGGPAGIGSIDFPEEGKGLP